MIINEQISTEYHNGTVDGNIPGCIGNGRPTNEILINEIPAIESIANSRNNRGDKRNILAPNNSTPNNPAPNCRNNIGRIGSLDLSAPLQIGNLTSRNRVFLAPMSGVSDVAFRKLAWKFGAGLVFSEMIASEALVCGQKKMAMKAQNSGLPIHAVQIAGRQAKWMSLAAKMAQNDGADLIDINMGCPSRRVTSGLSGSALMRDLDHAMDLIEAVITAVNIPVSLKMRLGWDENTINAPELAMRAQAAGIAMISIHGRTRCQFYKGNANWNAVKSARQVTSIPLVVNGDIFDVNSAHCALEQSQCDGVMIGRASYGAPWLIGHVAYGDNNPYEFSNPADLILEHFEEVLCHYGKEAGIRQFRKHLGWYLDKLYIGDGIIHLRKTLMQSNDRVQICQNIKHIC